MRHKFHIKDWGRPGKIRALKRTIRRAGGPFFFGFLLILVMAVAIFFGLRVLNGVNRAIRNEPTPNVPAPTPQSQPNNLIYGTFYDLFTGIGWLDQNATNLYRDNLATAFIFPPLFSWERSDLNPADISGFVGPAADGSETRCLPAQAGLGSSCLQEKNLKLYFQNQPLALPAELTGKDLVNLSIGNLDRVWLLGAVTQNGQTYEGFIFIFDGSRFTKVDIPFSSSYKGVLGFGGSDNDWLAVYGAYDGQAYRVRLNPENCPAGSSTTTINCSGQFEIADISRFFGIRVMNGGFQPVVIRSINGNCKSKIENCVTWYIYSLTDNNPKLVKLYQNKTSEIVGEVDFSPQIFGNGVSRAYFKTDEANAGQLLAEVTDSGREGLWRFNDKGFDKSKGLEVVSVSVNAYPMAAVWYATVSEADLADDGTGVVFSLSNDGRDWLPVKIGEEAAFSDQNSRLLFWRAVFTPSSDSETSPFFDKIQLDYKVKFL